MTYLIIILGVVAMLAGSNFATWNVTSEFYQTRAAAAAAQVAAAEANRRADINAQLAALERRQVEVRNVEVVKWKTIKQEVTKVVDRPVYRSCVLDDDGVRVFNAAAQGLQLAAAPGKTGAVPEVAANPRAGSIDGRPVGGGGVGLRPISRVPDKP